MRFKLALVLFALTGTLATTGCKKKGTGDGGGGGGAGSSATRA